MTFSITSVMCSNPVIQISKRPSTRHDCNACFLVKFDLCMVLWILQICSDTGMWCLSMHIADCRLLFDLFISWIWNNYVLEIFIELYSIRAKSSLFVNANDKIKCSTSQYFFLFLVTDFDQETWPCHISTAQCLHFMQWKKTSRMMMPSMPQRMDLRKILPFWKHRQLILRMLLK